MILGATGSIGKQTIEVISQLEGFKLVGISAHRNVKDAMRIIEFHGVQHVAFTDPEVVKDLRFVRTGVKIFHGSVAIEELLEATQPDVVMVAVAGRSGLDITLKVLDSTASRVCQANKEALVLGGDFLKRRFKDSGVELIPVDSEHSAVFQLLLGESRPSKVILTSSGGALRDVPLEKLEEVTVEDVLAHPTWRMGKKITVDSATMVNKGLELFEAMFLFDLNPDQLGCVICRDSFVHAMVLFNDGVLKMHAGFPDMRVPIAYSLTHPRRLWKARTPQVDILEVRFEPVDMKKYPAFALARDILNEPSSLRIAYCVADDIAVEAFLRKQIGFLDIYRVIKSTVERMERCKCDDEAEIKELIDYAERIAREEVKR